MGKSGQSDADSRDRPARLRAPPAAHRPGAGGGGKEAPQAARTPFAWNSSGFELRFGTGQIPVEGLAFFLPANHGFSFMSNTEEILATFRFNYNVQAKIKANRVFICEIFQVNYTVETSRAGTVDVACDDPQGWEIGASASASRRNIPNASLRTSFQQPARESEKNDGYCGLQADSPWPSPLKQSARQHRPRGRRVSATRPFQWRIAA